MDMNAIMNVINKRLKERNIKKRDLAEDFGLTEKAVYCWFNGRNSIPIDKFIKLVGLADAEIIIRDRNTHEVISDNPSETDMRIIEEREQLCKIKQALSILNSILKDGS